MAALGDTPEGRAQRTKMQSDLLIADMSVGLCKLKCDLLVSSLCFHKFNLFTATCRRSKPRTRRRAWRTSCGGTPRATGSPPRRAAAGLGLVTPAAVAAWLPRWGIEGGRCTLYKLLELEARLGATSQPFFTKEMYKYEV
jgi:hypothetical protein